MLLPDCLVSAQAMNNLTTANTGYTACSFPETCSTHESSGSRKLWKAVRKPSYPRHFLRMILVDKNLLCLSTFLSFFVDDDIVQHVESSMGGILHIDGC